MWASGVLLFVMLLGMFPFEMEDENYVNTAGLYSIWIQQIRTSWMEQPANAAGVARLSPECRDLLDKMFDVNQDSRITVDGILAHPWFSRPLPGASLLCFLLLFCSFFLWVWPLFCWVLLRRPPFLLTHAKKPTNNTLQLTKQQKKNSQVRKGARRAARRAGGDGREQHGPRAAQPRA